MKKNNVLTLAVVALLATNIFTITKLNSDVPTNDIQIVKENTDVKETPDEDQNEELGAYVVVYKHKNLGNPVGDWESHFPDYPPNIENFKGKTTEEMEELFGEAYLVVKHTDIKRELWVYMPNSVGEDQDNTGITIKFENNELVDLRIDDFNGIMDELAKIYLEW